MVALVALLYIFDDGLNHHSCNHHHIINLLLASNYVRIEISTLRDEIMDDNKKKERKKERKKTSFLSSNMLALRICKTHMSLGEKERDRMR